MHETCVCMGDMPWGRPVCINMVPYYNVLQDIIIMQTFDHSTKIKSQNLDYSIGNYRTILARMQ